MRFLRTLLGNLRRPRRLVALSRNSLPRSRLDELGGPLFNGIVEDLIAYTGFSREELVPYLLRHPSKHFESEFTWVSPKTRQELTWFYRTNAMYLFANSVHPYIEKLDRIPPGGRVLDFGAGVGCNSIGLARRAQQVDFVEVSRVQADFLRFRAQRHGLSNVREVLPYRDGAFDPVHCIEQEYDAIVAMDVLEHIPDYHLVVKHLVSRVRPGGLILENSPFDPHAADIAIHVRPSIPLEQAMEGMERLEEGVWRKR